MIGFAVDSGTDRIRIKANEINESAHAKGDVVAGVVAGDRTGDAAGDAAAGPASRRRGADALQRRQRPVEARRHFRPLLVDAGVAVRRRQSCKNKTKQNKTNKRRSNQGFQLVVQLIALDLRTNENSATKTVGVGLARWRWIETIVYRIKEKRIFIRLK